MLEIDDSHEPEWREEEHHRWLAMQSAYAEYKCACEVVEFPNPSADDSAGGESLHLSRPEGRQWAAFERYLEARLEFVEFQCDKHHRRNMCLAEPSGNNGRFSGIGTRLARYGQILQIVTTVLLCVSVGFLYREWKQVRDLAARDETRTTLSETREQQNLSAPKVNDMSPDEHSTTRQTGQGELPSFLNARMNLQSLAVEKPGIHQSPNRVPHKPAAAERNRTPKTPRQAIGARSYTGFSLSPMHRFQRVGPIALSLRSLDAPRRSVSLSIVSNSGKTDLQVLRLKQPVWINGAYGRRFQLVVDRIDRQGVYGHLIEPRDEKPLLRASRIKPGIAGNP